jgi:hypothetical protein
LRKNGRLSLGILEDFHNCLCERYLCVPPQCHKPALTIAYFPMCRYVRTNNPASSKKPFGNWQPEPFRQRGSYDGFTPGVAPLQLCFGQAFKKANAVANPVSIPDCEYCEFPEQGFRG